MLEWKQERWAPCDFSRSNRSEKCDVTLVNWGDPGVSKWTANLDAHYPNDMAHCCRFMISGRLQCVAIRALLPSKTSVNRVTAAIKTEFFSALMAVPRIHVSAYYKLCFTGATTCTGSDSCPTSISDKCASGNTCHELNGHFVCTNGCQASSCKWLLWLCVVHWGWFQLETSPLFIEKHTQSIG